MNSIELVGAGLAQIGADALVAAYVISLYRKCDSDRIYMGAKEDRPRIKKN